MTIAPIEALVEALEMKDIGNTSTPFNIRFADGNFIVEYYHPKLKWANATVSKIITHGMFSGSVSYSGLASVEIYNIYLEKLRDRENPEMYFDNKELLIIGCDKYLREVEYFIGLFDCMQKIVIAEVSLDNVLDMVKRAVELGKQDRIEINRVDFLSMDRCYDRWKGRFGVVASYLVFDAELMLNYGTRNVDLNLQKAWIILQDVLSRPGLFIGYFDAMKDITKDFALMDERDTINFKLSDSSDRLHVIVIGTTIEVENLNRITRENI